MGLITSLGTKLLGMDSGRGLDSVDKTIGYIASGIDKLTFTDQERSSASKKAIDQYLQFISMTTEQGTDRSKARRELANLWIRFYLGLIVAAILSKVGGLGEVATFIKGFVVSLGTGTLMVLGFYYGTHLARSFFPNGRRK